MIRAGRSPGMMEKSMSTLQDVLDKVREQKTALGSLRAFVDGLRGQIAGIVGISAADQALIDDIFGAVGDNTAVVMAAMEANVLVDADI